MTVVGRTFDELKEELESRGYESVCSDYFIEHNRIVFQKADHTFVLEYKKFYNYRYIVALFTELTLDIPEDCKHVHEQEEVYLRNRKRDI